MDGQDNICNAWAALKLVRMAIEQTCPAGVLPSEEAVLLLYGPEPIHEGEALAKAIIETVEKAEPVTRLRNKSPRPVRDGRGLIGATPIAASVCENMLQSPNCRLKPLFQTKKSPPHLSSRRASV
ncbi:hypothetical protein [Mesorhizobium sp.]|uniref:hypothetical protein n=1 Tax=Mesorhizobium sp. TaxID=1871066 RepID=UPI00257BD871|nr:hypothetical protein [Mesorhizobium sp.]